MDQPTILVTGGTGKTGRRIVERLVQLGHPVKLASRSGQAAGGAGAARFDWNDAGTYDAALAGVGRVYLMAPVGAPDPYPVMAELIDRALKSGVRRFVLLSASSLPEGGPAIGAVHGLLRQVAPEWAVLRPTWFMQNFSEQQHRATIRDEGRIYSATGQGRVPFVDADDIAEVGVRALVDERAHDTDHVITGPEAMSYGQAADVIAEVLGRPVRHVDLSEDALTERHAALGMEPAYARLLAGMDTAIAGGSEDRTTDTVARVTGRPPRSFREFVRAAAAAWQR
ncbi:NmrA family transcriptional regulator [Sorangium cellulosum]|uniref:NmrA family transcriptional regulator n=1 Tax=Sorangium cellulosum TaxID=56 RepID=A0A2L0F903_SORCE|nr:ergot alkaloid biosynthesis protein [Sorangium cellulosum]AUX47991.1 NmrA family transcriptional regulator [Sorangium cellulosum]